MPRISLLNITFKNSIAVSTCTIFEIRDCRFLRVNLSLITSQVRHRDSLEPHTIYVHCFLTLQMLLFGMFSKLFCSWNIFVFLNFNASTNFDCNITENILYYHCWPISISAHCNWFCHCNLKVTIYLG